MDETTVAQYIIDTFAGVETTDAFGYTFFFYGSDHVLPFATMVAADNEYDRVSNLDRPGVFRLNIGVSKQTFQSLYGTGKVDVSAYDFTAFFRSFCFSLVCYSFLESNDRYVCYKNCSLINVSSSTLNSMPLGLYFTSDLLKLSWFLWRLKPGSTHTRSFLFCQLTLNMP